MIMNGSSICFAPDQVRRMNTLAVNHDFILFVGLNFEHEFIFFFVLSVKMIRILITRATTPPSLFGIDRRMVYAKRKYHSG